MQFKSGRLPEVENKVVFIFRWLLAKGVLNKSAPVIPIKWGGCCPATKPD
jgi:hypothetical protein